MNEELAKALDALSVDMHIASYAPCPTCEAVSRQLGKPFGCDAIRAAMPPRTPKTSLGVPVTITRPKTIDALEALEIADAMNAGKIPKDGTPFGWDGKTATNMRWIAKKIAPHVRISGISISHYEVVARMASNDQIALLALAASEQWSVMKLREAAKDL